MEETMEDDTQFLEYDLRWFATGTWLPNDALVIDIPSVAWFHF